MELWLCFLLTFDLTAPHVMNGHSSHPKPMCPFSFVQILLHGWYRFCVMGGGHSGSGQGEADAVGWLVSGQDLNLGMERLWGVLDRPLHPDPCSADWLLAGCSFVSSPAHSVTASTSQIGSGARSTGHFLQNGPVAGRHRGNLRSIFVSGRRGGLFSACNVEPCPRSQAHHASTYFSSMRISE